jgi:hypothetical protein
VLSHHLSFCHDLSLIGLVVLIVLPCFVCPPLVFPIGEHSSVTTTLWVISSIELVFDTEKFIMNIIKDKGGTHISDAGDSYSVQ